VFVAGIQIIAENYWFLAAHKISTVAAAGVCIVVSCSSNSEAVNVIKLVWW